MLSAGFCFFFVLAFVPLDISPKRRKNSNNFSVFQIISPFSKKWVFHTFCVCDPKNKCLKVPSWRAGTGFWNDIRLNTELCTTFVTERFRIFKFHAFLTDNARCIENWWIESPNWRHNSRPIERRAGSEPRENFENLKETAILEIASFKNSNLWDCCILASDLLMFVFVKLRRNKVQQKF